MDPRHKLKSRRKTVPGASVGVKFLPCRPWQGRGGCWAGGGRRGVASRAPGGHLTRGVSPQMADESRKVDGHGFNPRPGLGAAHRRCARVLRKNPLLPPRMSVFASPECVAVADASSGHFLQFSCWRPQPLRCHSDMPHWRRAGQPHAIRHRACCRGAISMILSAQQSRMQQPRHMAKFLHPKMCHCDVTVAFLSNIAHFLTFFTQNAKNQVLAVRFL